MNPKRNLQLHRCLAAIAVLTISASVAPADELPEFLPYGLNTFPSTPVVRVNGTSPKLIDLLGQRVSNPYAPTRVQVQTELGATKLPAAAKFIRIGLTDADPQVRTAAAKSAGQVEDKSLMEDLRKLMKDKDARVRRQAVLSGAALGDQSVVNTGLDDEDATVIAAAVSVAGTEQAEKLAGALKNYPPATQVLAVKALGRSGEAKYADAVAALAGASVPIRAAVATALGQMKAVGRSAEVIKLLSDEHPTVRRSALIAVAAVGSEAEAQKRYIAALADEDRSVRESAAGLLQKSPTPDAIAALVGNLAEESARLHSAALDALLAIGQPVIPTAEKLLADADPRRREDASYLLGMLKSDARFEAHVALLKDSDWRVARQAAVSLVQIGRKDASPALAELARKATSLSIPETSPEYAAATQAVEQAIVACAMLGESSILPMCKTVMPVKTHAANIRTAAVYAIGRLSATGDKSVTGLLTKPMNDLEETSNVQFECVKAMGHLKLPAVMNLVGKDRESARWISDYYGDWMSHWIRCRMTGKVEPLSPLKESWSSSSSINPVSN